MIPKCESQIEQKMLEALIRVLPGSYPGVAVLGVCATDDPKLPNGIWIVPQHGIARYRVDFLVRVTSGVLVVECDGHDWHERTPEQAERDKSRDRALQMAGYQVLRFTGREIWRDANKCAAEVVSALDAQFIREAAD